MKNERLNKYDYLFIFIIFIIPYLNNGLWSKTLGLIPVIGIAESSILCLGLSTILWIKSKRQNDISTKVIFILILIAILYQLFEFARTIINTNIYDSLTVYRKRYIDMLTFLLLMRYMRNFSCHKIINIFRCLLFLVILQSVLYLLQPIGINIFDSVSFESASTERQVIRSIIGLPPYLPVLFAVVFIYYMMTGNKRYLYFLLLFVLLTLFTYTRNILVTIIAITFTSLFFHFTNGKFSSTIKMTLTIVGIILFIFIAFPSAWDFWVERISTTINSELIDDTGNYALRQKLITNAIEQINNNTSLIGLGYIRDTPKQEYSIVLGSDTFLAPVLWCEGWLGLLLRILPIAYLFIYSLKRVLQNLNLQVFIFSLTILGSIISQAINYVQTPIFMTYLDTYALLFLLYIFIKKYKYCKYAECCYI